LVAGRSKRIIIPSTRLKDSEMDNFDGGNEERGLTGEEEDHRDDNEGPGDDEEEEDSDDEDLYQDSDGDYSD